MLDQAFYFAIGFLTAALVAVTLAPSVARREAHAATRRLKRTSSNTSPESAINRDIERAQFAVDLARLEQRIAASLRETTDLRIALGQRAAELSEMERSSGQKSSSERSGAPDLCVPLQGSSLPVPAQQQTKSEIVQILELEAQANRDRAKIAILATRNDHLEDRIAQLLRDDSRGPRSIQSGADQRRVVSDRAAQPIDPAKESVRLAARDAARAVWAGDRGFESACDSIRFYGDRVINGFLGPAFEIASPRKIDA